MRRALTHSLPHACLAGSLVAAVAFMPYAAAQAPQPMPKDAGWSLRLPKDDKVAYRGALSHTAVNAGAFPGLHPAPNIAGLFAAIATHAIMADSAQSKQRQQIQEAADRVLAPYRGVLREFHHRELMQKGLARLGTGSGAALLEPADNAPAGWLVESTPLFTMTQDQRAIIVDNAIAIYAPGGGTTAAYQNVIRVVSHAQTRDDLLAFWTADEGGALKEESAALFAYSLDIALRDVMGEAGGWNATQRTFRYDEGSTERMERAQLVSEHCSRLVIKNLRGWLMSVPARELASDCADAGADPKP